MLGVTSTLGASHPARHLSSCAVMMTVIMSSHAGPGVSLISSRLLLPSVHLAALQRQTARARSDRRIHPVREMMEPLCPLKGPARQSLLPRRRSARTAKSLDPKVRQDDAGLNRKYARRREISPLMGA